MSFLVDINGLKQACSMPITMSFIGGIARWQSSYFMLLSEEMKYSKHVREFNATHLI